MTTKTFFTITVEHQKAIKNWFTLNVQKDLSNVLTLDQAFLHYKTFTSSECYVPLSKKLFANYFNFCLNEDITFMDVPKQTTNSSTFQGLILNSYLPSTIKELYQLNNVLKAGIYAIKIERAKVQDEDSITSNSCFYIGQTGDSGGIAVRLSHHIRDLENNKHDSKKLQDDFNSFGRENCFFYVLDTSEKMSDLKVRKLEEKKYIEAFVSSKIAIYNVLNPKKNYVRKEISIKGVFYSSLRAAERATSENRKTISKKVKDPANTEYRELESVPRDSTSYWTKEGKN